MERELVIALLAGAIASVALVAGLFRFVGTRAARYRGLVFAATALTFVVVVVGAYVRLSDAGLGCPDWPGCYGHLDVPKNEAERAAADARYPHMPVDVAKGWKEMGHRYIAGLLGVLLAAIALVGTVRRRTFGQTPWLPLGLVVIVLWQAALGRWTVTLLLKPVIVTLHLIGGMTILALLVWLSARQVPALRAPFAAPASLRPLAVIALVAVALQIVLGGWVSTNYAALACPDLPLCRGAVMPPMDFANAFHVLRELGQTPDGDLLSNEALTAIHWMHRVGALVVAAIVLLLALRLTRVAATARLGWVLAAVLAGQFTLGVLNVVLSLPLSLAAAHNGGAALLLGTLVVINFRLSASRVTVNRDVPIGVPHTVR
jgi:cytochrome c oxidase assembly protein subunit 15